MAEIPPRLRAVLDLNVAEAREYAGRHEYDGKIQDLSPAGVRDGLQAMAAAAAEPVPAGGEQLGEYDSAHLTTFERALGVNFGELELYRSNPALHVYNLDLACYDREYAAEDDRARARAEHLAAWPAGVDAAIEALDRMPA